MACVGYNLLIALSVLSPTCCPNNPAYVAIATWSPVFASVNPTTLVAVGGVYLLVSSPPVVFRLVSSSPAVCADGPGVTSTVLPAACPCVAVNTYP